MDMLKRVLNFILVLLILLIAVGVMLFLIRFGIP